MDINTLVRQNLIRQQRDWDLHKKVCPPVCPDASPPKFPFIVFSVAAPAEVPVRQWLYYFFTVSEAHLLLGDRDHLSTFTFVDRAIRGIRIEALELHADDRGHLVELFRKDDIQAMGRKGGLRVDYPPMSYLSWTRAGQMRRPHEHASQTDIMVFCRSVCEVFLWDVRENSVTYRCRQKLRTVKDEYIRLVIPPGVVHAYQAIEDGLVVNCPDKLYRGWDKKQPVDKIWHEDDPNAPFKPW